MSYGWLEPRPEIVRDPSWFGVGLDPTLATRWEEFTFVRDALGPGPGRLLDMGCGFEPGVHMMPDICAERGWTVDAIDKLVGPGPTHLWSKNPPHPLITRQVMDMLYTSFEDAIFDAVLSVSVLEHLPPPDRSVMLGEASRVLKPGGRLIMTTDGCWPRMDLPGFEFGEAVVPLVPLKNENLVPVSFMVGTKS